MIARFTTKAYRVKPGAMLRTLSFTKSLVCFGVLSALVVKSSTAQNAGARYEIDAKRAGVTLESDDALPRSREFLRLDSTYYVGWLYEGAYKFNHAADFLGFRNAAAPLEKALAKLERDFGRQLRTRTGDVATYIGIYKYQVDYSQAAYMLNTCYLNIEEPQKSYNLCRRYLSFNFQKDFFDAYNMLMWATHRNRFYTGDKFPFLGKDIDENEARAARYLDSALLKVQRNLSINSTIYPPGTEEQDLLGVYHYKAILHAYAFNVDSAERYFALMRDAGIPNFNNHATFLLITGRFAEAYDEYRQAAASDPGDKRLQEWAYYTSILDVYRGQPKGGVELAKGMVQAAGSTPGFGWYTLAQARALLYDGQLREAERAANQAAGFKELHIGTTLGQSHYDFTTQMIKLLGKTRRYEAQRFENDGWWYTPTVLGRMAALRGEKFLQQFLIVNQFAQNPERDRVIYTLFSTESTIGWDEVWELIGDFSTGYFLDRFNKELEENKRPLVRRYFQYFVARLKMKQGDHKEATSLLQAVLADPTLDPAAEKLLLARTYETLALCAEETDDDRARADALYRFTAAYPQLVPFSGQRVAMRLRTSGAVDEALVTRLKDCNIEWAESSSRPAPEVFLAFTGGTPARGRIEYWVTDIGGREIVPRQSCTYNVENPDGAGVSMAYRIFGVGGIGAEKSDENADRNEDLNF